MIALLTSIPVLIRKETAENQIFAEIIVGIFGIGRVYQRADGTWWNGIVEKQHDNLQTAAMNVLYDKGFLPYPQDDDD